MGKPSFIQKGVNYIYKNFSGNIGKMLLWTGATGWILSSIAQATAVVFNKKIPEDQKKFLIPQELSDAAINIILFIAVTKSVTKLGEWLAYSGRVSTPEIRKFLSKYHLDTKVGTKGFNITKEAQLNELDSKFDKGFQKDFYKFSDGVSFISSTFGSIISLTLTAIGRNKFAAREQKKSLEKEKMQKDNTISPYTPVLPAQNKIGTDNYRPKITTIALASKGSMRV